MLWTRIRNKIREISFPGQIVSLLGEQWKEELLVGEKSDRNFLQKRLGGKPWIVTCTIAGNGFSLSTSDALPDTGAAGYLFISRDLAKKALKYLKHKRITNFPPSPVAGFEGKVTQLIDVALLMNLKIHGRELQNVPFLVINMKHDLILGRKWFEEHGVIVDCRERKFVYRDWPVVNSSLDIPMDENGYKFRDSVYNSEAQKTTDLVQSQKQKVPSQVQNSLPPLRRSNRLRERLENNKNNVYKIISGIGTQQLMEPFRIAFLVKIYKCGDNQIIVFYDSGLAFWLSGNASISCIM
ncbi:hypothetical protein HI914_02285 [Erysiphe necator]|nr:hypothetical protein HI914_02285 [Erysiphe necator]